MFKNYFKTAWRNLANNKVYSLINILGLATGMAVALLIGLWVWNEYSYDKFLPGYDQLYLVRRNFNSNGETLNFNSTSLKLADVLRNQIPEFEHVAESDWMGNHGLMVGDKKLYLEGAQINGDFLTMFQYPMVTGNPALVLKDPNSIVLTQATAKALFGKENPLNRTVRIDNQHDVKVTGILKDLPGNSSLKFQFLLPFSFFEQNSSWVRRMRAGVFSDNAFQIFVQLRPKVSYAQVAPKIKDLEKTEKTSTNALYSDVILQPLANWHLYGNYQGGKETGGLLEYVRMFTLIGMLVLLIACINFVNLATARSEKRAREVGVRKAIGSLRRDLIVQFLAESFLLTLLAFLFSLLIAELVLPAFNALTGDVLSIPLSSGPFWGIMGMGVLITALIAGSRPAFYLSSFNPVHVLKASLKAGRGGTWSRKILVIAQFSCSIALIISTIIIYQQIQFAKSRPTGYDMNRLMMTDMNDDLRQNYIAVKHDLLQSGIVEDVTLASSQATDITWHSDIEQWPGKKAGETVEMGIVQVSTDYFKTLGMSLKEGRAFTGIADTFSVIFNETAVKRLRLRQPLGQRISWDTTRTIVGVAKDALVLSPFAPPDPTMFVMEPHELDVMIYRLSRRIKTQDAIQKMTVLFNKYNPAYPYTYRFVDAQYASKFNLEILIGKLSGLFAGLAVFISSLGLFGLAAFIAEQRTREIGIRKVLGASVSQVWFLLSKDFILLVLLSCLIATPVALYFLAHWLVKYDYRIAIGPLVFVLASVMALVITLATISFQAIRAAVANPVRSLRTE